MNSSKAEVDIAHYEDAGVYMGNPETCGYIIQELSSSFQLIHCND